MSNPPLDPARTYRDIFLQISVAQRGSEPRVVTVAIPVPARLFSDEEIDRRAVFFEILGVSETKMLAPDCYFSKPN